MVCRDGSGPKPSWEVRIRVDMKPLNENIMRKFHPLPAVDETLAQLSGSFFRNICFFVDCFHWKGHVGCSAEYNLDEYITMNINSI